MAGSAHHAGGLTSQAWQVQEVKGHGWKVKGTVSEASTRLNCSHNRRPVLLVVLRVRIPDDNELRRPPSCRTPREKLLRRAHRISLNEHASPQQLLGVWSQRTRNERGGAEEAVALARKDERDVGVEGWSEAQDPSEKLWGKERMVTMAEMTGARRLRRTCEELSRRVEAAEQAVAWSKVKRGTPQAAPCLPPLVFKMDPVLIQLGDHVIVYSVRSSALPVTPSS